MRLLFVSNYFPPEVNAPATRLYEHAKQWVADGHQVEVLTSQPNFPEGEIYKGYSNRFAYEEVEGIEVTRVPMYVAENKGTIKRTLSYLSFMLSAMWFSRRARQRPDVVVATSPQFFAALGGYFISRFFQVPFVLEVRDLWPESIVAVGAVKRGMLIRFFEWLEHFLYREADHIVVVTNAFKHFIENKGIASEKITVLKNGFDLQMLDEPLDEEYLARLRETFDLEGKFVAAYIGTIGMAHGVEVMLEAAQKCPDPNVIFMVVGAGAERQKLEERQATLQLPNVRLIDKQPKEMVPYLLALADVSVVHLKDSPLFRTVIPSKIFEAMATKTPIVLGVEGETKAIIEEAGAGIPFRPEDADALVEAVCRLQEERELYETMANNGHDYVHRFHDRRKLAQRYWERLEQVFEKEWQGDTTTAVKKLILHIGTHKTGTTSVQRLLATLRDALLLNGVLYPKSGCPAGKGQPRYGHHLLAWSILDNHQVDSKTVWETFHREVKASSADVVVVSAEGFDRCTPEQIKKVKWFFRDYKVEVIVYLRNPIDFMLSSYKQLVKNGKYQRSFPTFLRENVERCNYNYLVRIWTEVFGSDSVKFRLYDQLKRDPGIERDFLTQIGLDPNNYRDSLAQQPRANVSPSNPAIKLALALNLVESKLRPDGPKRGTVIDRLRKSIVRGSPKGKMLVSIGGLFVGNNLYEQEDKEWLQGIIEGWNTTLTERNPEAKVYLAV